MQKNAARLAFGRRQPSASITFGSRGRRFLVARARQRRDNGLEVGQSGGYRLILVRARGCGRTAYNKLLIESSIIRQPLFDIGNATVLLPRGGRLGR